MKKYLSLFIAAVSITSFAYGQTEGETIDKWQKRIVAGQKLMGDVIKVQNTTSTPTPVAATTTPTPTATPAVDWKFVNDKLQNALADTLTKTTNALGDATDFLKAQLPDVIRQLLVWKAIEAAIWCFIPLIVFLYILHKLKKAYNASTWNHRDGPTNRAAWVTMFYSILTFIAGATVVDCSNLTWLQIWVAPKIYLIEYVKTLIQH
jgi:hypothetical protein